MEGAVRLSLGRLGGIGLVVGGIGLFAAGALHPHGSSGQSFKEAMASMLGSSHWPLAHWLALASALVLAWAIWMLVDAGWTDDSAIARAGGRLTIAAALFMSVQFAVEIAAHSMVDAYAAGQPAPLVDLIDPLQAVGWPALGFGVALLAAGVPRSAPRLVELIGIAGAVAIGLAGLLVQGFHVVEFGPLFALGNAMALWIIWAGVRLLRGLPATASAPEPAGAQEVALGSRG